MKRKCIGLSSQMSGKDGHCAKLSHRSRCTEYDAVKQCPFNMRKCNLPEDGPSAGSHESCSFFLIRSFCFQNRNQFSGNKRKCYKYSCNDDSRYREYNFNSKFQKKKVDGTLSSENQEKDQTCNDRRDCNRKIDQCGQQFFALKLKRRYRRWY